VYSVHTIEEGNVGIYFVHGALNDHYTQPGVHWKNPFATDIVEITIRPQTETLESISTVTRDGIANTFHSIQVLSNVNVEHIIPLIRKFGMQFRHALVYDRVVEELRTFCANHTVDEVNLHCGKYRGVQ
jgi:regulator of protease activity HflC (stomatin/prohibitin superfamily)